MCKIIGNIAFTPDKLTEITIHSRGRTAPIDLQYVLEDGTVIVPYDQFLWKNRVVDEVAYIWTSNGPVTIEKKLDDVLPIPGCFMVSLESPHRCEYTLDPEFSPLGPLRDGDSRQNLINFLPSLIEQIGGIADGTEIVLCNPVPYQASLDRLMVKDVKLQKALRNAVWKGLFRGGFRNDFESRVARYKPAVVLNACTYDLKKESLEALKSVRYHQGANSFRLYATQHPSWWGAHTLSPVP